MKYIKYIDITDKWLKEVKPRKGNIKFLNYSITQDGEKFDSSNGILDINVNNDFYIGTWFKNNIWGNCSLQSAIVLPQDKRSADIRLFGNCPLVNEQTIEIKTLTSSRKDGLQFRLKQAKGQSSNVLVDVSKYPFDEKIIKHELNKYLSTHEWLHIIAVKRNDKLLFVWKKI